MVLTDIHFMQRSLSTFSLISHCKVLLNEKQEVLCIRVLTTLKEMVAADVPFGEKVSFLLLLVAVLLRPEFSCCTYGIVFDVPVHIFKPAML